MESGIAVQMKNITKTFGEVVANHNVSMDIRKGEILSLLGENGSGKTTLMNMLSGIYYPDSGTIYVDGVPVSIQSPKTAYDYGIGMIHQHFKLVDIFTAAENIVLGLKEKEKLNHKAIVDKIMEICNRYGFELDPEQKVYNMTVSQKQTLEIIKVLYRGADILILDEPTAVLTPQETDKLFAVIQNMRKNGKAIVIITHKLHEVLAVSDRVTVLRRGEYVGTVNTSEATENSLTEMMVGKKVELNISRAEPVNPEKRLEIRNISCYNKDGMLALDHVNFDVYSGEILGIAGISGCGQKELLEAIAGLQHVEEGGSITYYAPEAEASFEIIDENPRKIKEKGIILSFVPEDRLGMGLVGSMGMTGNMMLKDYNTGHSFFLNFRDPKQKAEQVKEELEVITPDLSTPVKTLSGGNVQKVLVGREIGSKPSVLMTAYAVRGLDINTSYTIYRLLNEQKKKGVAVIYVGEDLDVLLGLSDRILVLCGGRINGILDGRTTTKEEVGLRMTHMKEDAGNE